MVSMTLTLFQNPSTGVSSNISLALSLVSGGVHEYRLSNTLLVRTIIYCSAI